MKKVLILFVAVTSLSACNLNKAEQKDLDETLDITGALLNITADVMGSGVHYASPVTQRCDQENVNRTWRHRNGDSHVCRQLKTGGYKWEKVQ